MKVVATFTNPDDARLLIMHLEGSGIAAALRDEQTVTADWGLSNAVGGVKVDVEDEDFDRAVAIIEEFPEKKGTSPPIKRTHGKWRYLIAGVIISVLTFGLLNLHVGDLDADRAVLTGLMSVIVAFCIAGFAALLDL